MPQDDEGIDGGTGTCSVTAEATPGGQLGTGLQPPAFRASAVEVWFTLTILRGEHAIIDQSG